MIPIAQRGGGKQRYPLHDAGPPRGATDADREGFLHRHRQQGRNAQRAGAWRAWASSKRRRDPSIFAMHGSPRAMKAPTAIDLVTR